MRLIICVLIFFAGSTVMADEGSFYYCSSESFEFRELVVKQVITYEGQKISSTFKIDVSDANGVTTIFWQTGDVIIGSDDTFKGSFNAGSRIVDVDIKAPTFPDYKARPSRLIDGTSIYQMNCH